MRLTIACVMFGLTISVFLFSCSGNLTDPNSFKSIAWPQSSPEAQGMSSQMINMGFLAADQKPFINGIVIIRNGYLVAESYFNGHDKDEYHNIRSVSKSFLSALFGIAIREKYIPHLDVKIMDYFPEYVNIDVRFKQITIHDLITMYSGLDTDHNNYGQIFYSDDWIGATLGQLLIADPGEEFHYTTAGTHLLSAILTKATGMSSYEFAERHLLRPLGISLGKWEKGPGGYYIGGSDMHTSPRNMAKFGQLYLNGGVMNNIEIVPSSWVSVSIQDKMFRDNLTWGPLTDMGYGYLWWLGTISGYDAFIAIGHGGQFIIAIPELQMIVTTVSQSYNLDWDQADEQEREVLHLIDDFIMQSILD
jgi:CubicO group peptidase (beta-lactamase class C family)